MAEPALPQTPETTPVIRPLRSPPPSPLDTVSRAESGQLPLRRPPELRTQVTTSPVLQLRPKPAGVLPSAADSTSVSIQPGPKNETARMSILAGPPAGGIVQAGPGTIPMSIASKAFDSTPRWFCWGLLGLSALIFLIQIWNYALS